MYTKFPDAEKKTEIMANSMHENEYIYIKVASRFEKSYEWKISKFEYGNKVWNLSGKKTKKHSFM